MVVVAVANINFNNKNIVDILIMNIIFEKKMEMETYLFNFNTKKAKLIF